MKNQLINYTKLIVAIMLVTLSNLNLHGQSKEKNEKTARISMEPFGDSMCHWYGIHDDENIINPTTKQPKYLETEIEKIADNILLFQRNNGGWPKNYDMQAILTQVQINRLTKSKNILHTTFDNSTTYTHVAYLAQVYSLTQIGKYKDACLKGIDFILSAQYPNGGWPQYFPLEDNYSRRITFNDGVFIGIMTLLKKIIDDDPVYSFLGNDSREKIRISYEKGIECILNCQILNKDHRLTAWCQQHQEVDLSPAWARTFEPPSICNEESAQIVLFLMSINKPADKIKKSIDGAIKWFIDSKIYHTKIETITAPPEKSQWKTTNYDRIVISDSLAPPIWTRYYELITEKPLFCDRNSKLLYSLAEVSRERRSGYGWYTYAPQEVLDKYPEWQNKWETEQKTATN